MVSRTLAHYTIQKRIGSGGMGVVYLAQDKQLGRSVALKLLRDDAQLDEKARGRLLRERDRTADQNEREARESAREPCSSDCHAGTS